jgi:hypothetical protein
MVIAGDTFGPEKTLKREKELALSIVNIDALPSKESGINGPYARSDEC